MQFDYSRLFEGVLAFGLLLGSGLSWGQTRKAMPTASLPIEPASADKDVLEERKGAVLPAERREMAPLSPRLSSPAENPSASVRGGLLMTRDGFGAQLRFAEYAEPWLAVIQSLRYESREKDEALFSTRYGLMLGVEMHPWRQARFSPVLTLQAGGDRYRRGDEVDELNLFGVEAAAGIELRLARSASFLFQWTELYYPALKEQLFLDQKPGARYAGNFQVFFNLKWEGAL